MVQLDAYNSAIVRSELDYKYPTNSQKFIHQFAIDKASGKIIINPDYIAKDKESVRVDRWKWEKEKREYTINYLKEHYPNKDHAERYEKDNKWNKELMYPTEESKKCEYLEEDGRHCKLKRSGTGCYTCCFVCFTPSMCEYTNCPILPENRKPKKKPRK